MVISITHYAELEIGEDYLGEHEFEVEVDYEPGYPARLHGSPEKRYPAEDNCIEYIAFTHKPSGVVFDSDEFDLLMNWLGVFSSFSLDQLDDAVIEAADGADDVDYEDPGYSRAELRAMDAADSL